MEGSLTSGNFPRIRKRADTTVRGTAIRKNVNDDTGRPSVLMNTPEEPNMTAARIMER
jgi:hypothetical protein